VTPLLVGPTDRGGPAPPTTIAWHHPFEGPASASPLLIGNRIFFDGLRGRSAGLYHAVDDLGSTAGAVWTRRFGARFGANAAQDPRGGLWVAPWQSGTLLRLSELNGSTLQTVDVSGVLGLAAGYSVVTASTMSSTANGAPVLTFGAQNKASSASTAPQVAAVDVGISPAGTMLWRYRVSASALVNAATGQFPIVVNAAGAKRVVFRGTASATFFIGEP
jgi:hypothetical protein